MSNTFRSIVDEASVREVLAGRPTRLGEAYPFYLMTDPEMPGPGPDFVSLAQSLVGPEEGMPVPEELQGESPTRIRRALKEIHQTRVSFETSKLYYNALYANDFSMTVLAAGRPRQVSFIPGHLWGFEADGPRQARTMVIGKNPGYEEGEERRNFCGPTSVLFAETLEEVGFGKCYQDWYVTNVARFPSPISQQTNNIPAAWIRDCMPLLHQELRLVRPEFLLLLGSEAISAVLGKGMTYKLTNGQVSTIKVPLHRTGEEPQYHEIKVITSIHPAAVAHDPARRDDLLKALRYFRTVYYGNPAEAIDPEANREHIFCLNAEQLHEVANRMEGEQRTEFAIDCEFDGDSPVDGQLHTIQFSWDEKKACVANLRDPDGKPSFGGGLESASRILRRILKGREKRIIGHYFNADLWWLKAFDLKFLEEQFEAPRDDPDPDGVERLFGWQKLTTMGGFDTMLAAHAHEETSDLGLKELGLKWTTAGNYEVALEKWKKAETARLHKIGIPKLPGFGACPREILLPYAAYDADVTFRLYKIYNEGRMIGGTHHPALLDTDRFGMNSRIPFWISMQACLAFYEMHENGMRIDVKRAEDLYDLYTEVKARLLEELRSPNGINWPGFNPASVIHCREFLFGVPYNGKISKTTGESVRVRPDESSPTGAAVSLNLLPYKTTGKRPKLWEWVRNNNREQDFTAAVDKETLEVYKDLDPMIEKLLHIRYVSTITTMVLKSPKLNEEETDFQLDEDGNRVYDRGLLSYIQSNGKVHTNFSQTKETGRASSWEPPLQNLSSKREPDYKKICGSDYQHPLRSIFVVDPPIRTRRTIEEPWVYVGADYTGAELMGMAVQAGSKRMIDHCRRSTLPDSGFGPEGETCTHGPDGKPKKRCEHCIYPHPNYYDIHANVAVTAFRPLSKSTNQPCRPGRLARFDLEKGGLKHFRDAAKPVDFGYAYGMTADAAYRKAREGGADVTIEDSQALLDGLERLYPELPAYYGQAARCSHRPGHITNCFGRHRRTYYTDDRKAQGDLERQFKNFPIQSLVADGMSLAMGNLRQYRRDHPHLRFRLCMQLHDDVMSRVPVSEVPEYYDTVIPECMTNLVAVWPTDFDGNLRDDPEAPYYLVPSRKVFLRWGEKIKPAEAEAIGLPLEYCGEG